jgi:hypothetical protein
MEQCDDLEYIANNEYGYIEQPDGVSNDSLGEALALAHNPAGCDLVLLPALL